MSRTTFASLLAAFACATLPAASFAEQSVTSKIYGNTSATADFYGRRVQVPGAWTVKTTDAGVDFIDPLNTKRVLHLLKIKKDVCTYQPIRSMAVKLWSGATVDQSVMRLETLTVGRSRYRGYKWVQPSGKEILRYWCIAQDSVNSLEIIVPADDKTLVNFVNTNLLFQMAVRKGL